MSRPKMLYTRWQPDDIVKVYDEAGLLKELKGVSKEDLNKYYTYAISAYELNVDYEDENERPKVNIMELWKRANNDNGKLKGDN